LRKYKTMAAIEKIAVEVPSEVAERLFEKGGEEY
jgi:hypothetical protein